uniref:NADH-ubiquinone oxidoreductase chain 1 n=1 Tax=Dugesia japonica TaxID=6161 RepID=G9M8V6_DUGJA|nr:NADH dehydrogenase subunit 1 [Dugesia japonica]
MFSFTLLFYYSLVWLGVLVSVLFFTMLERKIMGYIQLRKGPNKVGFLGVLNPIADTIKLFFKSSSKVLNANYYFFWLSPLMAVLILLFAWCLFPLSSSYCYISYSFLLFMAINGLNVYCVLWSGWSSNSKYSLLGCIRGSAQIISYEVLFVFCSLFPVGLQMSVSFHSFVYDGFFYFFLVPFFALIWFVSLIAETNRSPFDFSEGESELVSGFNTEYGSLEFACLFLGEYGQVIFVSCLWILFYWFFFFDWLILFFGSFFSLVFIFLRSSFPRFRYDLLMSLSWFYGLLYVLLGLVIILF